MPGRKSQSMRVRLHLIRGLCTGALCPGARRALCLAATAELRKSVAHRRPQPPNAPVNRSTHRGFVSGTGFPVTAARVASISRPSVSPPRLWPTAGRDGSDGLARRARRTGWWAHFHEAIVAIPRFAEPIAAAARAGLGARDKIYVGNIDKLTGEILVS